MMIRMPILVRNETAYERGPIKPNTTQAELSEGRRKYVRFMLSDSTTRLVSDMNLLLAGLVLLGSLLPQVRVRASKIYGVNLGSW